MIASVIIIDAKDIVKEKVKSFLTKGRKITPARIGVKFGGWGTTLLRISKRVKKIKPLMYCIMLF